MRCDHTEHLVSVAHRLRGLIDAASDPQLRCKSIALMVALAVVQVHDTGGLVELVLPLLKLLQPQPAGSSNASDTSAPTSQSHGVDVSLSDEWEAVVDVAREALDAGCWTVAVDCIPHAASLAYVPTCTMLPSSA